MTMPNDDKPSDPPNSNDFEQEAQQAPEGIFRELLSFLIHNASWWLTPIVLVLLLLGLFLFITGSAAAPFIYTLF